MQLRRCVPRLLADDAAEVALVGEAKIGRQPRQALLAAGESLQRVAGAQADAMAGDRVAGRCGKDAAEVVGRDRDPASEVGQGAPPGSSGLPTFCRTSSPLEPVRQWGKGRASSSGRSRAGQCKAPRRHLPDHKVGLDIARPSGVESRSDACLALRLRRAATARIVAHRRRDEEAEMSAEQSVALDTIVLIHGLWMTPLSWEHWIERYRARGLTVLAPPWPGMDVA
jgi:hypothetical protein